VHGSRRRARRNGVALSGENRCLKGLVAELQKRFHHQEQAERDRARQLSMLREANQHLVLASFSAADMQAVAELARERQTVFLTMLAHELRNPIASITVATAMMKNLNGSTPKLERLMDIVERQCACMVRLVDDLLDVSRIRTGKLTLQFQDVSLADVLESAVATAKPAIEQRLQKVEMDLPAGKVLLRADHLRLVQLFSNLLVNASKFSPPATTVRVGASVQGAMVAIAVRDQGRGIAAKDVERIFDLFEQVTDEVGHTLSGGLGIGLLLVRAIATMHGGTASVASDGVGRGAEFTILLPLLRLSAG